MQEMLMTLTKRSFAAGRLRNLIAAAAITLSASLFTSIISIGVGTMQSMTLMQQIQKLSRSDGDFRNMNKEQFETMRQADFIESAGLRMPVGFLTNASLHNTEFDILDEVQADLTFCMPSHGNVPEKADEIVASDMALRDLGVEPQVGAEVIIEFTAHGREYSIPMTVSGWYESLNDQLSVMWGASAFVHEHPDIFAYTYPDDFELAGTYWSDILADSPIRLQEKMNALACSLEGTPEHENPAYLHAVMNNVTHQTIDLKILVMGAAFILLFIFCGYLLIYNVFDIAVMQEIRRFGLYRTIGMSRRQVKKLMNRQTLWLSCAGIPLGLFIGFFIGKAALPDIMNTFSTEYQNITADVSPSPVIFLISAFLTALTIFLSTRKPVRIAADTPPIEAFRYTEGQSFKRTDRKSAAFSNISRLAWSNLGRSKRRSIFIILSLMLCVVLLNCVETAANSMDIEKQTAYMMRTDFAVVNAVSTNNQKGFSRRSEALSSQTIADISSEPGVTDGSPIYKNTADDVNVTYDFPHASNELTSDNLYLYNDLTFCSDDSGRVFGLGCDGRPLCNVYGMEETALARMDLREGETDAHKLYEKMEKKEGVLVGVNINRVDMSFLEIMDIAEIGEVITVYKNGTPVMELPVLAKAALNGDDMEIGYTCSGPNKVGGDGLFLYLPADIWLELYDEPSIYKYSFNVDEEYQDDIAVFLDAYRKQTDTGIHYLSSRTARESAIASRKAIRFVGGLVSIIFGIAGILNLINTLITSILIRRHEFATMQSIGMTRRQLAKMMVLESLYYAAGACLSGLILSVILNLTLVRSILASMWQYTFQFTLLPALAVSLLLLLIGGIVPVLTLHFFHKGSIVEQLRAA